MSVRIDVRRTAGGLRLLVPVMGESSRRSIRLSYAQAGALIEAIRGGDVCCAAGDLEVSRRPADDVDVGATLAHACAGTYLRTQDLEALGTALSAHMPDCMKPLPLLEATR
jgi:hypothetical protein